MGYTTTIINWDIVFTSPRAYAEFFEDKEGILANTDCPIGDKRYIDVEPQKDGSIRISKPFEGEPQKMYDRKEWIPYMAMFCKGSFEGWGEENDDIWKVEFNGLGNYRYFGTEITFVEMEVE